jgi:hypothetical protein
MSEQLNRSHVSRTASSASLADSSIRYGSARHRLVLATLTIPTPLMRQ